MGIAGGIATDTAGGGTATTDATAEQWHIKSGKTAYIASGKVTGTGYFPGMMQFDGSADYYSKAGMTASGNKVTVLCIFNNAGFTGDVVETICEYYGASASGRFRAYIIAVSSDHSTAAARRSKLQVLTQNSAGTTICRLISDVTILDGENHSCFYEFDGDAGTAVFEIDGVDADDTGNADRIAPTTGTLQTGATATAGIGAGPGGASPWGGALGFVGIRDVGGLTSSDFFQTDGAPKSLDLSTWTEWGAQPLAFSPFADLEHNLGSAGAFTRNGSPSVALGWGGG